MRLLAVPLLLLAGCTNKPGALTLSVRVERPEIGPDEPLLLQTVLTSTRGNVCLAKTRHFDVTMQPMGPGAKLESRGGIALCGMAVLGLLPIEPFIRVVTVLDVGDGFDRFDVLARGEQIEQEITVWPMRAIGLYDDEPHLVFFPTAGRDPCNWEHTWPPGEYRVTVELVNDLVDFHPPPLFWKPYDQPVRAESRVIVRP